MIKTNNYKIKPIYNKNYCNIIKNENNKNLVLAPLFLMETTKHLKTNLKKSNSLDYLKAFL